MDEEEDGGKRWGPVATGESREGGREGDARGDTGGGEQQTEELPITRWLTSRGVCSRQQAKRWIAEGRVRVDGAPAAFATRVPTGSGGPPESHGHAVLVQVWLHHEEIPRHPHLHRLLRAPPAPPSAQAEVERAPSAGMRLVTLSTKTGGYALAVRTHHVDADADAGFASTPLALDTDTLHDAHNAVRAEQARANDVDQRVLQEKELVYLLYHKPRGLECTTDPRIPCSWVNFIDRPDPGPSSTTTGPMFPSHIKHQLISVGRLDKDSEGLLLLTTDSAIVNPLMQSSGGYEKEYEVLVNRPFPLEGSFITRMRHGEAIRRGTVPILPPLLVEAIADDRTRASFRGEEIERGLMSEEHSYMSANQQKKLLRKQRKKENKEKRRAQLAAESADGMEPHGEEQGMKRKRGHSLETDADAQTQTEKKMRQHDDAEEEETADASTGDTCVWFRIVLQEGKNRQIRRMVRQCSDQELTVKRLIRVRLGQLRLQGALLHPGSWRHLTPDEVATIRSYCAPPTKS